MVQSSRASQSDAYAIEVHGQTVGIVARDERSFRFYAALSRYSALEGAVFSTPHEAERAARRVMPRRGGPGLR